MDALGLVLVDQRGRFFHLLRVMFGIKSVDVLPCFSMPLGPGVRPRQHPRRQMRRLLRRGRRVLAVGRRRGARVVVVDQIKSLVVVGVLGSQTTDEVVVRRRRRALVVAVVVVHAVGPQEAVADLAPDGPIVADDVVALVALGRLPRQHDADLDLAQDRAGPDHYFGKGVGREGPVVPDVRAAVGQVHQDQQVDDRVRDPQIDGQAEGPLRP